jgi:O-methyltransferase
MRLLTFSRLLANAPAWRSRRSGGLAPIFVDEYVNFADASRQRGAADRLCPVDVGAIEEVRALAARHLDRALPAMKAVGVREILALLRGEASREGSPGPRPAGNAALRQAPTHLVPQPDPRLAADRSDRPRSALPGAEGADMTDQPGLAALRINVPMTDALEHYIDRVGYREHPSLAACRAEAMTRGAMAAMQIAPEQGAFLQLLVRLLGARRILEVGTFTGYSAMAMALALSADGRLVTCDVSDEYVDLARRFWAEAEVADRIDARLGDAADTLDQLLESDGENAYDLAFIDADKPGYPAYYRAALRLVRPGGLILLDDTLLRGRVATGALPGDPAFYGPAVEAVTGLSEAIHADAGVQMVLLPWRDGMTIVRKL